MMSKETPSQFYGLLAGDSVSGRSRSPTAASKAQRAPWNRYRAFRKSRSAVGHRTLGLQEFEECGGPQPISLLGQIQLLLGHLPVPLLDLHDLEAVRSSS